MGKMGRRVNLELAEWPDGSLRLTWWNKRYGYAAQWIFDEDGDIRRTSQAYPSTDGRKCDNFGAELADLFEKEKDND